jgi:M penetrans paralogue family 26
MKQKLNGSVAGLVLGILSIVTCPAYGIIGLVLGIIGLAQSNKAIKQHQQYPDLFEGIETAKAGRILSIIGIVLSSLMFLVFVFWIFAIASLIVSTSSPFDF